MAKARGNTMKILFKCALAASLMAFLPSSFAAQSIARDWDEEALAAIRIDTPHPPVHARNLFSLSAAMYDAWAAYDSNAVGFVYRIKPTAPNIATARREAISYAAYRMLRERYALSRNASNTLARLDAHMIALGYRTNNFSLDTSTPAGVGNAVYTNLSSWFLNDGSLQAKAYEEPPPDQGGYLPKNEPLVTGLPGAFPIDVNRWQPLAITNAIEQNGLPNPRVVQKCLGAQWLAVRPFALTRKDASRPWIDPGPPPTLDGEADPPTRIAIQNSVVEMIRRSSEMTPDDGVTIDISPGAFGNNHLGTNDGHGHRLNPATGKPYQPNVVKRGDFARVLAEFWADGPNSETPPGHWNVFANGVSDYPGFKKRLRGTGRELDDLEWDVKVYLALNAALHDAACAAWSIKRCYDGWRPITLVRYMGQVGQTSDPSAPRFDPSGLPLVSNLIEQVTAATAAPGGRHEGKRTNAIVIRAWPGQPKDPTNQYSGVKWIDPGNWVPYQKSSFITPAFPGYISGHSTFSRAAAEVLAAATGTEFFPGGIATYTAVSNRFLTFEKGPSQTIQLQWSTYYDAADQAGMSRIWGGIHPSSDDLPGRRIGSQAGKGAWALAQKFFDRSITTSASSRD